jgi:hypothetical protein
MDNGFFTAAEYDRFGSMVRALQRDAHGVADTLASFGAPRVALNAMADKYAADHALAYGEHAPELCDEWCSFPTGNEPSQRRVASRHTMFFDQTGPTELGRTYLTFGCSNIECGYRDFVVADDYDMARSEAIEAFDAIASHVVEVL